MEAAVVMIDEGIKIIDVKLEQYVQNLRVQRGDKNVRREADRSKFRRIFE